MFKFKKNNKIDFNLLDFEKILSIDIWNIINKNSDTNYRINVKSLNTIKLIKFFFGTIYRSIFTKPTIHFSKKNELKIFYVRTLSRPDLKKHSEYYEKIEGTTVCILDDRRKDFNLSNLIKCVFLIFKHGSSFFELLQKNNIKTFSNDGIFLLIKLFYVFSDSSKILPHLLCYKKLISFQEMLPVENTLCQFANLNKIETYALEHAMGFYKEKGPFWERYPIVHYLNSVCKNILCWGKVGKSFFQKHTDAKILIIGKAGLPDKQDVSDGITFLFQSNRCISANKRLQEFSSYCNKSSTPISNWFKEKNNIMYNDGTMRDGPLRKIVVGWHTNLLLELGFLGLQIYVIENSVLAEFLPKNLIIKSIENHQFVSNKDYPFEIWKNFIECSGNESVSRYKSIVLK